MTPSGDTSQGPSPQLQIRTASAHDIPELVPFINRAFEVETFLEGDRTDAAQLAGLLGRGELLVAAGSGALIASVYTEVRGMRGYFGMLAVNGTHRGTGLGRLMVGAAEDHCRKRGCTHMDITVLSLRTELPPFYRKLGYLESGRKAFDPHPQKLKDGFRCSSLLMSKVLEPVACASEVSQ